MGRDDEHPKRLFRVAFGEESRKTEAAEEIRFHLEEKAARLEQEGMSPEEAWREAQRRFGDVDQVAREVEMTMQKSERVIHKAHLLDGLRRDVGFSWRQLLRNPGFSAIAVFTIALAMGATTSVFSVVDGIMLRPLPYEAPDELVMVWADYSRRDVVLPDKRREWLSWPNFADFRDEVAAVEAVAAFGGWGPTLTGDGINAQRLNGAQFSHGMFSRVLGVEPALGRGFLPEDDVPDGPRVVLISDGFWRNAFGADPSIVNQTVRLNDVPFTVVGVMPPGFRPPSFLGTDVWTPMQTDRTNGGGRGGAYLRAVGRVADDASVELAQAQARDLGARLEREYPEANLDTSFNVYPLQFDMVQGASTALWVLFGAVGFVLLIACVNVANLLLARGTGRQAELAVRVAMGAGRRTVLRQLMIESLLLATIGGACGVALAFAGTEALVRLAPPGTPLIDQVAVDGRILFFAALATMLTGTLFGALPAIRAAAVQPADTLREGGRSGATSTSARIRNTLVVGQISLALMLLVGAGLLVRSFENLRRVDLGFEPDGVLSMQMQLPNARYTEASDRLAFFTELENRISTLPGVEATGSITNLPLAGQDGDTSFRVEGSAPPREGLEPSVWLRRVTPGYFDAIGLDIVRGRSFDASDDAEAARVIIVNETLERDYFDGNAVGRRLNVNDPENPVWREVVGVARDIKNFGIRAESRNALYLPYAQAPTTFMFTTVRASVDPETLVAPIRAQVSELDPGIALSQVRPMEELVSDSLGSDRFTASLLAGFAMVALLLAVIGLYGVVSYSVNTRVRELGVRIALGAPESEIRTLILRWALALTVGGIVVGGVGAVGVTRLLDGLLYGVPSTDVGTFGVVAVLMAGAAILASIVPAIRATRVDPITVLKSE